MLALSGDPHSAQEMSAGLGSPVLAPSHRVWPEQPAAGTPLAGTWSPEMQMSLLRRHRVLAVKPSLWRPVGAVSARQGLLSWPVEWRPAGREQWGQS